MNKYQKIVQLEMGPHAIHIQEQQYPEKQWLTTQYKLTDKDFDAIVVEWPTKQEFLLSDEDFLDPGDGQPIDVPRNQEVLKDLEEEESSHEEALFATPIE